jgi:LysR family transcriptional regulator, transcription activator of glutamate synthase operon
MEIDHLREFVILAQTGNFMEAADLLYVSQSTLSKHIKNIEEELGVPLFDRTTRKVGISKFGQILLPFARQIIELQEQYTALLQSSLATERDTLTVGSIPALAQYKIIDIFVNFKKSRPQSTLNVLQAGSEELKELLRQKKCDLAFIRFTDEVDDDLVQNRYAIDNLVAVLPVTHPLAGREAIQLELLADEDFLLIEKQTYIYRLCVNACRRSGFEPKIAFTDHKVGILVDLVIKGMGIALLMKQLALYAANPNIAIIEIAPSVTTQISLCYLKEGKLSEAARHFVLCAGALN